MKIRDNHILKNLIVVITGFVMLFAFVNNYKIYEEQRNQPKPIWVKEKHYDKLAYQPGVEFLNCHFKVDFADTLLARKNIKSVKVVGTINPHNYDITIPLVFEVKDREKTVYWKKYELQKCLTDTGFWQEVEFVFYLSDFVARSEYVGHVYFWNKDNSRFSVKKLRVEFYTDSIPQPIYLY